MDSEGKKDYTQIYMDRLKDLLKENISKQDGSEGFFKSSTEKLHREFLKFILGTPPLALFEVLMLKKIHPGILKVYLEENGKDIISILLKDKNFLGSLINLYVDNIVSLFGTIKSIQKKSKAVQQSGMEGFKLIKQNINAKSYEHDNALDVMEKQQIYLSNEFNTVNGIWANMSNTTQVNDAQVVVQKLINELFVAMYENTFRFQCLMAKQFELTQQSNERADRLQSEKDEVVEQLSKARTDAAVAKANINSLNKQLEDEKERADKLQEENKKLSEDKTNAAVAETDVKNLKAQLKDKEEIATLKDEIITDKNNEIVRKNQELKEREEALIEKERKLKEAEELLEMKERKLKLQEIAINSTRNELAKLLSNKEQTK